MFSNKSSVVYHFSDYIPFDKLAIKYNYHFRPQLNYIIINKNNNNNN